MDSVSFQMTLEPQQLVPQQTHCSLYSEAVEFPQEPHPTHVIPKKHKNMNVDNQNTMLRPIPQAMVPELVVHLALIS